MQECHMNKQQYIACTTSTGRHSKARYILRLNSLAADYRQYFIRVHMKHYRLSEPYVPDRVMGQTMYRYARLDRLERR